MMVPRSTFINKIRELGYKFKSEKKRVSLWKRSGSRDYLALPKSALLEEKWVMATLAKAGVGEEEIKRFIGEATA